MIISCERVLWLKPHRTLHTLCSLHFQKIAFFGYVPRFTAKTENFNAGNVNYKFLVVVWY